MRFANAPWLRAWGGFFSAFQEPERIRSEMESEAGRGSSSLRPARASINLGRPNAHAPGSSLTR